MRVCKGHCLNTNPECLTPKPMSYYPSEVMGSMTTDAGGGGPATLLPQGSPQTHKHEGQDPGFLEFLA